MKGLGNAHNYEHKTWTTVKWKVLSMVKNPLTQDIMFSEINVHRRGVTLSMLVIEP